MGTYLARAVPWPLLLAVSGLTLLVVRVLQLDPWTLWPLQGVAVGLVAGGVGWCLDEPCADVVDTLPRPLAWRTLARLACVGLVLAGWSLAVWWARDGLFGHARAVWWQGVAAALIALAAVTWARAVGHPTPGRVWAVTIVSGVTVWSVVRPAADRLPLLPYADGRWEASAVLWTALAGSALAVLVLGLLDARWWPAHWRAGDHRGSTRGIRRRGRAPA